MALRVVNLSVCVAQYRLTIPVRFAVWSYRSSVR